MAHEVPRSEAYQGLSRKVLQYSEAFAAVVEIGKTRPLTAADWAPLEELVDVAHFERIGVFLTAEAEVIDWAQYKKYISQYGGVTTWEATLRRLTEGPNVVFLELEERNTKDGVTDFANTIMIYTFNAAGKVHHLDVYVSPLYKKPSVQ